MSILDPMDQIRDTQSLTKFLRSKDSQLSDIVDVAIKILSNSGSLKLPNGELFVLELVADRINDNNKFKNWKYSAEVWQLFLMAVKKVAKNERERVLRRIKFIEVLTKIFSCFYEVSLQPQCFTSVLEATKFMLEEVELHVDEPTCMSFLVAYLNIFEMDLEDQLVIEWTHCCSVIFELPTNEIDYMPSKKNITRFYVNCLAKILNTLQNLDTSLEECHQTLCNIIIRTVIRKDTQPFLLQGLQEMLKQDITKESIFTFYKILVANLGNKDVKLVEDVYLIITDMVKYNDMSEKLIEVLATLNKPLTTEFFASVFDSATSNLEHPNWKLIGYIINLDATLAMQKASIIIEMLNKQDDNVINEMMPQLIASYVRARDLYEFFTEVWLDNIDRNKSWASPNTIEVVAENINDLSTANLKKIINYIHENGEKAFPLLLSVVKGLLSCPIDKVTDLEEIIFTDTKFLNHPCWELNFYLLILYPEQSDKFDLANKGNDKYFFYSVFRVVEITANIGLIDNSITGSFIKFIEDCKDGNTFIEILLRWHVILGVCFPKPIIEQVATICVSNLDVATFKTIMRENEDIYEQKVVISALLKAILAANPEYLDLIPLVPIQSIDKVIKVDLINKLTEHKYIKGLLHLLVQATSKSKIETDLKYLIELVDSDQAFDQVFILSWTNHVKQAKSDTFIDDTISMLNKAISKVKKLTGELKVVSLILKESDSSMLSDSQNKQLQELKKTYLKSLTKMIQKDPTNVQVLKSYLRLIDRVPDCYIDEDIIKRIGKQIKSFNDKDANELLFKIYAKEADVEQYKHILSLYYILLGNCQVDNALQEYFTRISSSNKFDNLIVFVLQSITSEIEPESSFKVMKLLQFIIKTFKKDGKSEKILGVIISIVLNQLHVLSQNTEALNVFLSTIKSSLTEFNWCFTQYSIEMIFSLVARVSLLLTSSKDNAKTISQTYILSTQILSQVLLFHRFRLTSRHHMVMNVFVSLLSPLTLKSSLSVNPECSRAYSRLLSNLCEPSITSKSLASNQLTTASTLIKKSLRKYLPSLLVNYINLALTKNFSRENNDEIMMGIFNIFDVFSPRELETTVALLDSQGIVLYKTIYNDYKDHGKWKDI